MTPDISDALKFVAMFGYPISQSVPHIYLSALPFSPSEPSLLQYWKRQYPNTLVVEAGRLEKWPAILHVFHGHRWEVQSVAFSPDGTRIVSGSGDNTIRLWDAASGTAIEEPLQGHSAWVKSVAFSPDGARIVSGSDDKTIRLWDAASGTAIGEPLQGHSHWVESVAFSPDGARIVSGSGDKNIQLLDAASGSAVGEPLQDTLSVTSVTSVASCTDGSSHSKDSMNLLCPAPVIPDSTPFPDSPSRASPPEGAWSSSMFSIHSPPLDINGWLTSPDGKFLFWVPYGNRLGLLRPGTLKVFGTAETRINFESSAHGAKWTHCNCHNQ